MTPQSFYAHSLKGQDPALWQPLLEHLIGVARLARERGDKFGAQVLAEEAGLLHDVGKYTPGFQKRLYGDKNRVDHSIAGSAEILNAVGKISGNPDIKQVLAHFLPQVVAHCIAGHHAGLPDSIGQLDERLKEKREELDPQWRAEIAGHRPPFQAPAFVWRQDKLLNLTHQLAFLGRMIFSCLVDADYRDTEAFYARATNKPVDRDWPRLPDIVDDLIQKLDVYMDAKRKAATDTPVNRLRDEIFTHVKAGAQADGGVFSLNVPTGGGKTLASLAFALDHAKRNGLERIIYAIPYTSIIDQTAAIFKEALGADVILEHHSSIDEEKISGSDSRDKLRLAMEDWAAPIVVTTNVQLFESLHSHRPSRCRRLHNIARSVLVLDEAQTIPLGVLRPCVAALKELALNYRASIVLCTATQPAIAAPAFEGGLELGPQSELAPDPRVLHEKLARVRIVDGGKMQDAALCDALAEHSQVLVIVNSRAHALKLFHAAQAAGLEGCVHLTTRQYGAHRRKILDRIRARLKAQEPCRLIATSLVEAGVDVDFPRVWRAEAGLDQIAQAAGRCNREGSRRLEESVVTVFCAPDDPPPDEIKALAEDFDRVRARHADLLAPAAVRDFFNDVYWRKGEKNLDKFNVLPSFKADSGKIAFRYNTVGENFRLIESKMAPVIVVADDQAKQIVQDLEAGRISAGKAARASQNYIVQVPPAARKKLIENRHVVFAAAEQFGDQFAVLQTSDLYREDTGLMWEDAGYLGVDDAGA